MPENDQNRSIKDFFSKLLSRKKTPADSSAKETEKVKTSVPKLILKIFLWFIAATIALLLLVIIFINPILTFSVTNVGSAVTGLDITVDDIDLSLANGTFKIINLQATNPAGYETPLIVNLGTFYISWDKDSLLSDKILIRNIELRKLHVNAEVNDSGKLNFLALAEKFIPAESAPPAPEPAEKTVPPQVWIEKFSIQDIALNWRDKRKEYCIDGFGFYLEKLDGSLTGGEININNIRVANPKSYALGDMLAIGDIKVKLIPETIYSPAPVIDDVSIAGLFACAEFSTDGDFNILALVDSFQNLLPQPPETDAGKPAEKEPEKNPSQQPKAELKSLSLSQSWFHLEDDRIKVPVKIPLAYAMSNYSFVDDMNINPLPFLHEQAIWLRDTCSGVTNADQLALNFVKSAAESGMKLFTSAGGLLVKGASSASGALVQGGGVLIDKTHESGKKVINGIVEVFK